MKKYTVEVTTVLEADVEVEAETQEEAEEKAERLMSDADMLRTANIGDTKYVAYENGGE